jgi:hypothetical protein
MVNMARITVKWLAARDMCSRAGSNLLLLENDSYLIKSIGYCLQNPVRAGIVSHAEHYIWSSARFYFRNSNQKTEIVGAEFVNQLFGSKEILLGHLASVDNRELSVMITKHGEVLGSENFLKLALKKHNRRRRPTEQSKGVQREDERFFDSVEKVLWEFTNIRGTGIDDIDTGTWAGKRLRGELLVKLRDNAGLKYKEIADMSVFGNLGFASLRELYRRTKQSKGKA